MTGGWDVHDLGASLLKEYAHIYTKAFLHGLRNIRCSALEMGVFIEKPGIRDRPVWPGLGTASRMLFNPVRFAAVLNCSFVDG